jgi:hypothetical protein
VLWAPAYPHDETRFPRFTLRDVEAIARILRDDRRWSQARVRDHVRALEGDTLSRAVLDVVPGGNPDRPHGEPGSDRDDDDPTDAVVLNLDATELPTELPPSWVVARRTPTTAAVIVFTPSWLDWRHYELCGASDGGRRCFHEGEPTRRVTAHERVTLRVPLRVPPGAPVVPTHLFMPRLADLCGGSIVSVPGPSSHVDPDGRHAVLEGGPGSGSLEVAWDTDSRACPEAFFVQPHFFLEAAAADAAMLEASLLRRER